MKKWQDFDLSAEDSAEKHLLKYVYISREINILQRYSNNQIHSRVDPNGFLFALHAVGQPRLITLPRENGKINVKEGTG